MRRLLIMSGALLMASASFAVVDVQKSSDFPSGIRSLAIAPLPCSEEVNCVAIEKHLNKSVSKHFPATVVGSDRIKQALFDMSVVDPTKDTVMEAARKLGCDAVLLPSILGSTAKDHWNVWTEYDTGKTHQSDAKSVMSAVQVLIIGVDGKLLMKGEATGESYLQTDQTLFAETQIDTILRKALK